MCWQYKVCSRPIYAIVFCHQILLVIIQWLQLYLWPLNQPESTDGFSCEKTEYYRDAFLVEGKTRFYSSTTLVLEFVRDIRR